MIIQGTTKPATTDAAEKNHPANNGLKERLGKALDLLNPLPALPEGDAWVIRPRGAVDPEEVQQLKELFEAKNSKPSLFD